MAQEVNVEVSYDTVYAGNIVGVRFSMENWQGDLIDPDYGDFLLAGGPQISSSMSISGNQRTSSKTITLFLRPPEQPGVYIIPSMKFKGENKEAVSSEKKIFVIENPDGIRQEPSFRQTTTNTFDRQYRRTQPPQGKRQRF